MTYDEFRVAGHKLIDWVADFRAGIRDYSVAAQIESGESRSGLPTTPPEYELRHIGLGAYPAERADVEAVWLLIYKTAEKLVGES